MTRELDFASQNLEVRSISPFHEMGAYEALWSEPGATFKSLSDRFARNPGRLPSDFVPESEALECANFVKQRFPRLTWKDLASEFMALANTRLGCATPPILSNCSTTRVGGT